MPVQVSAEERNETGLSLELIGGIILFFDFLVLFFLPAGLKLGQQSGFAAILGLVAVVAMAIVIWGHIVRVRAGREG
jgi:hypothetical protein